LAITRGKASEAQKSIMGLPIHSDFAAFSTTWESVLISLANYTNLKSKRKLNKKYYVGIKSIIIMGGDERVSSLPKMSGSIFRHLTYEV
jgi:hypothetical protein